MKRSVLYLGVCLLALGCRPDAAVQYASRSVSAASFDRIEVYDRIELYLRCNPDSAGLLRWEHNTEALDQLSAEFDGQTLRLRDQNKGRMTRPGQRAPRCTLNAIQLASLRILDAARVQCLDTLRSAALELYQGSILNQELCLQAGQFYGGSDNQSELTLSGRINIISWSLEQGSSLNARNLWCDDAYIRHYTTHDAFISPDKQLVAYLFNSGNLVSQKPASIRSQREGPGSGQILIKP
ncbi:MAG: GIN domain-containing protein [Bacteroidia bacterium]